ncbi:hypothetical protein [Dysgonomonas termitidis]|jgi:hypothetical protein|uniref:Uncharacterized protein n=1 Tax=Dysgonomonas termitidis TaxID=1516126 RepID=A0ABV9KRV3_9BACT
MQIAYDYIGCIDIPDKLAEWTDHPGDCYKDLARLMQIDEVRDELGKIDAENLKLELKEYGAWTDEELNNHNDNLVRILWITCCNINERNA